MSKFETKNTLFVYLWVRMFYKKLFYLTLALSNLFNCEILRRIKKILNFRPKIFDFGVSGLDFSKNLSCQFCNQHTLICQMTKFLPKCEIS